MKKNLIKSLAFLFFSTLILSSCSDSTPKVDLGAEEINIDTTEEVNQLAEISYSVPTPNELFEIVKLLGGELNIDLINSLENKDSYMDLKSKALNFGVYSADLGYMSCFSNGIDFLKYTKAVENLGTELGISEVFDQTLMTRIESNEENFDSLFTISNQTYYDSYLFLEENRKGQELSLIIIGGYIESLYIISKLVTEYTDNNPIIEKIGDQRLVLENIIDFCSQYADEVAVSEALSDLLVLQKVFEDNMTFVEADNSGNSNADGIATFASSGSFKMNQETFDAVATEITSLRNNITQK